VTFPSALTAPTRERRQTEIPARPGRHTHTALEIEFERAGPVCHFVLIAPSLAAARSHVRRLTSGGTPPAPLCGRSDGCAVDPRWLRDWTAEVCELCQLRLCRECQASYGASE
jgi:hypothetical protein